MEGLDFGEKKAARQKKKLSDDDTRRLLAALPYDLRVMSCTGLLCTLRVSEMLGLQEKHLDFPRNMILVQQRVYRGNLDTSKNGKHREFARNLSRRLNKQESYMRMPISSRIIYALTAILMARSLTWLTTTRAICSIPFGPPARNSTTG